MARVFVSSTFRDMHAEREELVKRVLPQLRKLCEDRGVTWGEVDLRWGITDEETAEGKVLPICLDDDSFALSTALALRQQVREAGIPIAVLMLHDGRLATLLSGLDGDERSFESLHAFGLLDRTCTPELILGGIHEILARAIHDRYL